MKHKFYMQYEIGSLEYFHLLKLKLLQLVTNLKVVVVAYYNFFASMLVRWSFEVRNSSKLQNNFNLENNFKLAYCLKIKVQINNDKKIIKQN